MRSWYATIVLIALLGASHAAFGQSRQDNWNLCFSNDPEQIIAGCSALIQSGQETGTSTAKAFDNRGVAYMRKGAYDRAIQDYDDAIRINPRSANAFYNRGLTYRLKGDYGRAIPDYDQALRLKPGDADSFYGRSMAYAHQGDYLRAVADYARWRGILGITLLCLSWVAFVLGIGEWFRNVGHQSVQLKRFIAWMFAASAAGYVNVALRSMSNTIHQRSAFPLLVGPVLTLLVAYVCGMAWWTIWKGKLSARGFAIAASLMHVLIFVRQFVPPSRPTGDYHVGTLIVGIVGLLVFLRQDWPPTRMNQEERSHFTSLFADEISDSKAPQRLD